MISTMIWVVTYRDSPLLPQQELIRYTKESAERFAEDVVAGGGIAIVTEDVQETDNPIFNTRSEIQW